MCASATAKDGERRTNSTANAHKDGLRRRTSKGRGRATEPGRGRASQTWPDHRARRRKTAPHEHRAKAQGSGGGKETQMKREASAGVGRGRPDDANRLSRQPRPPTVAKPTSPRTRKENLREQEQPGSTEAATRERHTRPSDSTAVDISYGIGLHLDRQQKETGQKRRRGHGIAPTGRRRHAGRSQRVRAKDVGQRRRSNTCRSKWQQGFTAKGDQWEGASTPRSAEEVEARRRLDTARCPKMNAGRAGQRVREGTPTRRT
ncbi:hypothetical protein ERJ75_000511500 [Trypanosoma vivax]|nr:hypothetical protein ERJ75_000511500 [Trypanosoma vivax]